MSLFVLGMQGLGDNIYQRAVVRHHPGCYLATPWPELYRDLDVKPVRMHTPLRTQAKNIARQSPGLWQQPAPGGGSVHIGYSAEDGGMLAGMERRLPIAGPFVFDLPDFEHWERERPIAMIRPVTRRREWDNPARNPRPQYLAWIADQLMATHRVISVAALLRDEEWLVGAPPPAHERYHHGELDVTELMALVASASVVVGGVGWIVPAALAYGTPCFCLVGGQCAYNAPEFLTDPRLDTSRLYFALPDPLCRCQRKDHYCNKRIPDLEGQWAQWISGVSSSVAPSRPATAC